MIICSGKENVRGRALTEEHARDSFENLLFSVCRFRELTGLYPQNITVSPFNLKYSGPSSSLDLLLFFSFSPFLPIDLTFTRMFKIRWKYNRKTVRHQFTNVTKSS